MGISVFVDIDNNTSAAGQGTIDDPYIFDEFVNILSAGIDTDTEFLLKGTRNYLGNLDLNVNCISDVDVEIKAWNENPWKITVNGNIQINIGNDNQGSFVPPNTLLFASGVLEYTDSIDFENIEGSLGKNIQFDNMWISNTADVSSRYWGVSSAETLDSTGIDALANNETASDREKVFSLSPSSEYMYYCYPVEWGQGTFYVGGFETGFVESIVSHTDEIGQTMDYYVYRSPYTTTGTNINIQVT